MFVCRENNLIIKKDKKGAKKKKKKKLRSETHRIQNKSRINGKATKRTTEDHQNCKMVL